MGNANKKKKMTKAEKDLLVTRIIAGVMGILMLAGGFTMVIQFLVK